MTSGTAPRTRGQEDGTLLLILMVGVAVMSIGLGAATQAWSKTWKRDSEEELIFRGNQYVDALLAYKKEHGGNLPLSLEDLMKEGPRRLRYIRKLFRDPINPGGKWGLLYLAPGGQAIYDPVAAQKAAAAPPAEADSDGGFGGETPGVPTSTAGWTPINMFDPNGTGVNDPNNPQSTGGPNRGNPQGVTGFLGRGAVGPPPKMPTGSFDDDIPSEPPIGWPIAGVISRASGVLSDKTFKIYKGHEHIDEWQFQVFDRPQAPNQPTGANPNPNPCYVPGAGYGGPQGCPPTNSRQPPKNPKDNLPSNNPFPSHR